MKIQLIDEYKNILDSVQIETHKLEDFRNILLHQSGISVVREQVPYIVLSDGKMVKCAYDYYTNPDTEESSARPKGCYMKQKRLFGKGFALSSATPSCVECHLRAISSVKLIPPIKGKKFKVRKK